MPEEYPETNARKVQEFDAVSVPENSIQEGTNQESIGQDSNKGRVKGLRFGEEPNKLCPVFGDLGATWVPWGSPEHLSMQHGYLRGQSHRSRRGRRNVLGQPLAPSVGSQPSPEAVPETTEPNLLEEESEA